ncbi:MAG: CPBP family intramembrane metalloprotease [Bryobacterales bacterium]|nr:CPBP family intramembrane metalloprotease [Bryobacterales bacterium]
MSPLWPRLGLFFFFWAVTLQVAPALLVNLGGQLLAGTGTTFLAGWLANTVCLRVFERRSLAAAGLGGGRASVRNLALGLGGGAGVAFLVLAMPVAAGMARFAYDPEGVSSFEGLLFIYALLAFGAAGEEMLFRGYAFQLLLGRLGVAATVVPAGVLFALLHGDNPYSTWLALTNTAGFGILFGVAFLRSRDLWLPIGLHLGWNLALPFLGANLSGFTMRVTGLRVVWDAPEAALWSGGAYGPEGGLFASMGLVFLALFLWKAPLARQVAPLWDPPAESA